LADPAATTNEERLTRVGDVELAWDELGDPAGEPMLMVMGLGAQLIHWDPRFCELLGERGFRVIRFDNRDSGHSTKLRRRPPGTTAMLLGSRRNLAYSLDDLADDAAGLLDELGIDSAHFVGASMGGMIAQVVGYRRPEKVRSLALIMTGSGRRVASLPRMRAFGTLLAKPARSREQFIELLVKTFGVIGSPDHETDEEWLRKVAAATWDRGHSRAGVARQLHAITASGDRTRRLHAVRAATVVIHGKRDPLVRLAAGRSLANAIPGARLVEMPGMGHDLPPPLWPRIVDEIAANARRASDAQAVDAGARSAVA
jgi:pimeloyl-ACP methyl ester carboxylesterase